MPRHANYVPQGIIPAVLLPFDDDLAILPAADERLLAAVFEDVRSPRPCMGDGSGCSSFKTRFARCSE